MAKQDELPYVVCADVGSVANGRFGWASSQGDGGTLPGSLAVAVSHQLRAGRPVALGFECPLFVPVPRDEQRLGCARIGEGARAWSAGAGAGSLATGLAQVTWVLREVRKAVGSNCRAYLDWSAFCAAGAGLFVWEAFVTASAKAADHCGDARTGVQAFGRALPDLSSSVRVDGAAISLVGAALLHTGWSEDLALLSASCAVVKA